MVNQKNKQTFQWKRSLVPLARFPNLATSECPINSKVYHILLELADGIMYDIFHECFVQGSGILAIVTKAGDNV